MYRTTTIKILSLVFLVQSCFVVPNDKSMQILKGFCSLFNSQKYLNCDSLEKEILCRAFILPVGINFIIVAQECGVCKVPAIVFFLHLHILFNLFSVILESFSLSFILVCLVLCHTYTIAGTQICFVLSTQIIVQYLRHF